MRHSLRVSLSLALVLIAGSVTFGLAACGGDESPAGEGQEAKTGDGADGSVKVTMTEFAFDPAKLTTDGGSITITADNAGAVEHEFVLVSTDLAAGELPTKGDGSVDEAALEAEGGVNAGEIEGVAPGEGKDGVFALQPGSYVFFCNLPGHYAGGMYGSMKVD